jgi:uncharacterized protein (TIGR00369 family)
VVPIRWNVFYFAGMAEERWREDPDVPEGVREVLEGPADWEPALNRALRIRMGLGEYGLGYAWFEADPEIHWGATRVHGGAIPPLIDIAGAIAVAHTYPDAMNAIEGTIEMSVNYLKGAKAGRVLATGQMIHRGRRIGVAEVNVQNQGRLCVKAIVSYQLRPEAHGPAEASEEAAD